MSDHNDIVARMRAAAEEDQANKTNFFHESLVMNPVRPPVSERVFVSYFLPYFAGQVPVTSKNQFMAEWISIAGTPMNEVVVINDLGQPLFIVPALFDTSFISPQRRGTSFSDIANQYELRSNHIPVVANRYLANALDGKLVDTVGKSGVDPEQTDRWLAIFARYGVAAPQGATTIAGRSIAPEDDDDLIY